MLMLPLYDSQVDFHTEPIYEMNLERFSKTPLVQEKLRATKAPVDNERNAFVF